MKNVIITGASGMVGKGVLIECIESEKIEKILVVGRNTTSISHPKLKELLLDNLDKLGESGEDLSIYDACYFCAGVTSVGKTEEDYSKITYDLTIEFAKEYFRQRNGGTFCYISGTGTDTTEKGNTMWARVKGRTENGLKKIGFEHAYMFRPGYIQPLKGIKSKTKLYQAVYTIFWPIYTILKHFPSTATNTTNVGKAMLAILDHQPEKDCFENLDINQLAK